MSEVERAEQSSAPVAVVQHGDRAGLLSRAALKVWVELFIWLSIAGVAFVLTFEFANQRGSFRWGAAAWPRAVIVLLVAGALLQFAIRVRNLQQVGVVRPRETLSLADRLRILGVFAIPLLYIWSLPRVGFYMATPVFLVAYLAYLGERRWTRLIGVPLLIYGLINLMFTRLFYVALPTGNWPGFYDFSHWFITLIR